MRARTARRHAAAALLGISLGLVAACPPAFAADRALELVSPPGSDGDVRFGGGVATPDGDFVCFNAERQLGDAPSNGIQTADDGFCARRTASGWETFWVTGPAVRDYRGWGGAQVYYVSPDGARVAFASDMGIEPDYPGRRNPDDLTPPWGTRSAYMWEGGQVRWLAPAPEPLPEEREAAPFVDAGREPLAVSEDLRHGIFVSSLRLVDGDRNSEMDVYEWTPDGIRLVTRDADGEAIGGRPGSGGDNFSLMASPGSVSRDGSRIFFEHRGAFEGSPPGVWSVFMREGDRVVHVSPRRGPGPAQNVQFEAATPDGETAFISSTEQLTEESKNLGSAIYRYDVADDELSLLADSPDGSGVVFLGVSANGETVVFRTNGFPAQLLVWHRGVVSTLGALGVFDGQSMFDAVGGTRPDKRALRISDDGQLVVFASFAALDGSPGTTRQVFRWTPADGVRRISRDEAGSAPTHPAGIGNFSALLPAIPPYNTYPRIAPSNTFRQRPSLGRVIAEDGRIFFETQDQLVPEDVNDAIDVYEWHDGTLRLVTPGTQSDDALYHDNSADGRTVFFTTRSRLIPELDRNAGSDLYAAREGGGFPLPPRAGRCAGEECQGPITSGPALRSPGSATFNGPGNEVDRAPVTPHYRVARLTRRQRRELARRGRTVLRVSATARGGIDVKATARIRRRNAVVARARSWVRPGAATRVPLALSRQARSVLRTKRRLRLVITVTYSEADRVARQVVMLRG